MLSTWCAAPRVVADFARFAPPRHSTMTMHEVNWAHLENLGATLQAKPSQREVGLTTTLITRLLTNQLAQSRSTADVGDQSSVSGLAHHTGRLSMAWKRSGSNLLSPTCLRLSDIRPQHVPNINLDIVGSAVTLAGWFTCTHPHLKPDKLLLINSQAVYRPSLVENSRVTMSSVEQYFA